MMMSAIYWTNKLFNSASSLKQTVHGYICRSIWTYYSDSEPTSLYSYSLRLHALRRSNKYQFYSLWFDQTGALTHDIPHGLFLHDEKTIP